MAEFIPFKGFRYNDDIIDDMADVVAPPYDVIAPPEQDALYHRHPHNVIRLILGKSKENDHDFENVHTRSKGYLDQWRHDRILIQDVRPGFYLTAERFQAGDRLTTRFGLMGLVGLRPFSDGIILPHEHTFSKVKSERLMLMKATNANLCPIFGIYGDENGGMGSWQRTLVQGIEADIDLVDDNGIRHELWRLEDPEVFEHIRGFFQSRKIYIADGHHRYETALNYREWIKSRTPHFSADHPANYIMMNLSSMQDPGMVILPAHRLLKQVSKASFSHLIEQAPRYFDIIALEAAQEHTQTALKVQESLARYAHQHAIGLISRDPNLVWVLKLKNGVMTRLFGHELAEPLRVLDVSVLTHLLMVNLLGLDQAALDDPGRIVYCTSTPKAVRMVAEGESECAFILNPTKIEQVQRVAESGMNMPRKSTYFYPKIISGQVFNILE